MEEGKKNVHRSCPRMGKTCQDSTCLTLVSLMSVNGLLFLSLFLPKCTEIGTVLGTPDTLKKAGRSHGQITGPLLGLR
jgi:hypothetical protein